MVIVPSDSHSPNWSQASPPVALRTLASISAAEDASAGAPKAIFTSVNSKSAATESLAVKHHLSGIKDTEKSHSSQLLRVFRLRALCEPEEIVLWEAFCKIFNHIFIPHSHSIAAALLEFSPWSFSRRRKDAFAKGHTCRTARSVPSTSNSWC